MRIAVIGAGLIGRTHIEVLRSGNPGYTLAAVADPSPAAAEEAHRLGYAIYSDLEEMLDRTMLDGAIVAVPNQLHISTSMACVARKIPILVEKPIADSVASALDLVEAAEQAGVPTLVGHHRRQRGLSLMAPDCDGGTPDVPRVRLLPAGPR